MLKYFFTGISLLLAPYVLLAQSGSDSTTKPKVRDSASHQLSIGVDLFQPLVNNQSGYKTGYEFAADYYLKNDIYLVAEGGFGDANINYSNLTYKSSNNFFRLGINKSVFPRTKLADWDMAFVGVRYGMAFINRGPANYVVVDSFFGNTSGNIPGASITGSWVEIVGGMRVELIKGFFAGYTIRGKFRLNDKAFTELAPAYIAGYGKGDKNSIFDFNFYLSYAIRWKRKFHPPTLAK